MIYTEKLGQTLYSFTFFLNVFIETGVICSMRLMEITWSHARTEGKGRE
jgi:hypothetical protein